MTLGDWLQAHPYLESVARFHARVAVAADAAAIAIASPAIPAWDDYSGDFLDGVPLLRSSGAAIDLQPAGKLIATVIAKLSSDRSGETFAVEIEALAAQLRGDADAARAVVDWLVGDEGFTPMAPGLLRCVGWIALAVWLRPMMQAYEGWRDDDRWLRRYCPSCGSLPAMAQLSGVDPGRRRLLCCGCCGTRWRFARTGCPFCEATAHRLASLTVAGEGGLRLDYCESCRAYLKTYDGQGSESVLLADWTSLHLDIVAQDRGLTRAAASLYELEPIVGAPRA